MLIVGHSGIPDLPLIGSELFHFVGIGPVQNNGSCPIFCGSGKRVPVKKVMKVHPEAAVKLEPLIRRRLGLSAGCSSKHSDADDGAERDAQPRTSNAEARTRAGFHREEDRKSTRLNSSHQIISYAVFCL